MAAEDRSNERETQREAPSAVVEPASDAGARKPDLALRDLHKTLSGMEVLRGVDFEVFPGETFVIMGLSGTGKSVTLRHIVGLMKPDRGDVRVFGQDVASLSSSKLKKLRLKIGFLFQSGALINWMTLRENLALPLHEHRPEMREEEIEERVLEKLREVNLEDAVDKYPAQISGGMKKRAALARSIILEPRSILYDEPTSGLDPVMAAIVDDLVNEMRDSLGVSQVVVTHDVESAYRIADRIGLLFGGRLVAIGTPDEIRSSDDPLVQQFIQGSSRGPITELLEARRNNRKE